MWLLARLATFTATANRTAHRTDNRVDQSLPSPNPMLDPRNSHQVDVAVQRPMDGDGVTRVLCSAADRRQNDVEQGAVISALDNIISLSAIPHLCTTCATDSGAACAVVISLALAV